MSLLSANIILLYIFVCRRHSLVNLLADGGIQNGMLGLGIHASTTVVYVCCLPRVQVYQAFESQFSKSMDAEIAKEAR